MSLCVCVCVSELESDERVKIMSHHSPVVLSPVQHVHLPLPNTTKLTNKAIQHYNEYILNTAKQKVILYTKLGSLLTSVRQNQTACQSALLRLCLKQVFESR